jgi:hypothetical protein
MDSSDETVKVQLPRYIGTQFANKKFSHHHHPFLGSVIFFGLDGRKLSLGPEPNCPEPPLLGGS